jgi:hypothetical protein
METEYIVMKFIDGEERFLSVLTHSKDDTYTFLYVADKSAAKRFNEAEIRKSENRYGSEFRYILLR